MTETKLNPIIEEILGRKVNYCHVLEVKSLEGLIMSLESLINIYTESYRKEVIIDFIDTMVITPMDCDEEMEEQIYQFDITEYLMENIAS